MKIGQALAYIIQRLKNVGVENPQIEAFLILSKTLDIPKERIITQPDVEIERSKQDLLESIIKKREQRIPLAYILKEREFFGLEFYVEEGVLVPRPETEILVEEVLKRVPEKGEVLGFEVGVGSGCISVSLLKMRKNLKMVSIDISDKSIEVSRINAVKHGVLDRLFLLKISIFRDLELSDKFDFVVSNPPYIREYELPNLMEEVKFEPRKALISGKEGTEFYEKISTWAKEHLKNGGFVAFEIGIGQSNKVFQILQFKGYRSIEVKKDLQGIDRVIIGYNLEE